MNLTATQINYYRVCHRKLWLFANNIQMEQTSDLVADGKLVEAESYQHRGERFSQINLFYEWDDISFSGKVDYFDAKNKVIHETKRSNKVEQAHIWQVKFYLWLMKLNNIEAEKGIIEYPKLREREEVYLEEKDIDYLEKTVREIEVLIEHEECPPVINARICKSCSYYDFCYSGEED